MSRAIIIGGGLAGLSTAHTILERGGRVLVLDKNPFLGGNSTKATSGINGTLTQTQIAQGIKDSRQQFYEDTAKGARELLRPAIARVLTYESGAAVEWLQEAFELDLSLVARLGGHSFPRTHRGKERFPGMTITYALMEKFEKICQENPDRAQLITKARVTEILQDGEGGVIGVKYEKDGVKKEERGVVVIASGGYGADFSDGSLLKKYRPDVLHLSTTNGEHCTGDGVKMASAIGANLADMKMVQVHPTGLVDPKEPDAKVKFLAAEALRGVGGLLLDANGKRFCNELGHRDYVTGEMNKNKGPFRLVLNGGASKEIEWHCKHYVGRGLMKRFGSGEELAQEMGISASTLAETFEKYNANATPEKDEFKKKYFHNLPLKMNDYFHVAVVTPLVHYTMGGVEITPKSELVRNGQPIRGLWAAGEVCGGVHGVNRLGGSSLLDCVVFGRVAGREAARFILENLSQNGGNVRNVGGFDKQADFDLTLKQSGVQTQFNVRPGEQEVEVKIQWNGDNTGKSAIAQSSGSKSVGSVSQGSSATTGGEKVEEKKPEQQGGGGGEKKSGYTMEEVSKHNTKEDCWVVVNGKVLNATDFLKDHPGGPKAILLYAGKDASEEFNMLHKPDVVEKYAPETILGDLITSSGGSKSNEKSSKSSENDSSNTRTATTSPNNGLPPLDVQPGATESEVCGGTSEILPAERKKASFDVETMVNVVYGGADKSAKRMWILSPSEGTDGSGKYTMTRAELLKEHVTHFLKVHEPYWGKYIPSREEVSWMSQNTIISGSLMNHYGLFLPTILSQCSSQQHEWWLMRAFKCEMVGSYAQTELGHGSNVRGIQTIAEYDSDSQQFVLNTPTLRSIKWWPGTLGKVATHAIVYAQLILNGKEHGVHAFMVQIRDENHTPIKGVELGDLGPKVGDGANDTGFMRMKNVRIPREFMLNKFQQVTPEGEYVKSKKREQNSKLHYATMMFTRGTMVNTAAGYLGRAVCIAIRYSAIRTQGFKNTSAGVSFKSEENSIIDYQVQRYRLFKSLALTYCINFLGIWMLNRFKDIESGGSLENIEGLPEIAATSAGLKAMCTFIASQSIEDCRKCCGGNGYLLASGVAQLSADYVWQTTAEGDWVILILQTARFLMKAYKNAKNGGSVSGPIEYLSVLKDKNFNVFENEPQVPKSVNDFKNFGYLKNLFYHRALIQVVTAGEALEKHRKSLGSFDKAWNACSLRLFHCVVAHCYAFMLDRFVDVVEKVEDEACKKVLSSLVCVFALSNILDGSQWNLKLKLLDMAKEALEECLDELRPEAVSLVDALDIPDRVLNSAIGMKDGNIYEALYRSQQLSTLNKTDPFEGYETMRKHLDIGFLKNGNNLPTSSSL